MLPTRRRCDEPTGEGAILPELGVDLPIPALGTQGWILVACAALLVLAWLSASLLRPGRGRSIMEWLGAIAMYAAIASIMGRLLLRFWADDQTALAVLFGFLVLVFGSGFLVSLVMTARAALGREDPGGGGATH